MSEKPKIGVGVEQEVVSKMKERYNRVYPLIFLRSVERAKSAGELYDILESLPSELPLIWDEKSRRWVNTDDITCSEDFDMSITQ